DQHVGEAHAVVVRLVAERTDPLGVKVELEVGTVLPRSRDHDLGLSRLVRALHPPVRLGSVVLEALDAEIHPEPDHVLGVLARDLAVAVEGGRAPTGGVPAVGDLAVGPVADARPEHLRIRRWPPAFRWRYRSLGRSFVPAEHAPLVRI